MSLADEMRKAATAFDHGNAALIEGWAERVDYLLARLSDESQVLHDVTADPHCVESHRDHLATKQNAERLGALVVELREDRDTWKKRALDLAKGAAAKLDALEARTKEQAERLAVLEELARMGGES